MSDAYQGGGSRETARPPQRLPSAATSPEHQRIPDTDVWAALDDEARRRAAALAMAKGLLASSTTAPDALDLFNLATYIVTGEDPWAQVKERT